MRIPANLLGDQITKENFTLMVAVINGVVWKLRIDVVFNKGAINYPTNPTKFTIIFKSKSKFAVCLKQSNPTRAIKSRCCNGKNLIENVILMDTIF